MTSKAPETVRSLISSPTLRPAVLLVAFMLVVQQASGVNAVLAYSTPVLKGLTDQSGLIGIFVSLINVAMTFPSLVLIDVSPGSKGGKADIPTENRQETIAPYVANGNGDIGHPPRYWTGWTPPNPLKHKHRNVRRRVCTCARPGPVPAHQRTRPTACRTSRLVPRAQLFVDLKLCGRADVFAAARRVGVRGRSRDAGRREGILRVFGCACGRILGDLWQVVSKLGFVNDYKSFSSILRPCVVARFTRRIGEPARVSRDRGGFDGYSPRLTDVLSAASAACPALTAFTKCLTFASTSETGNVVRATAKED